MKKGFTLVEMIIVIGIIGVLIGVLLNVSTRGIAAARATSCLANLKSLASAVHAAATPGSTAGTMNYPLAGSKEVFDEDASEGTENIKEVYSDKPGWISWDSRGAYPSESQQASSGWRVSTYETDEDRRLFALTNGSLWAYTHCSRSVYLCPTHASERKKKKPFFSYVMSAFFGWSSNPGAEDEIDLSSVSISARSVKRAERRLLFAEMQFVDFKKYDLIADTDSSSMKTDAILQYKGCADNVTPECLGFNHEASGMPCAHVVFLDGHVEKLAYPKNGLSEANKQELAQWLCEAEDVSFVRQTGKYVKVE